MVRFQFFVFQLFNYCSSALASECGSGTPWCGAFSMCLAFFELLVVFLFSMGDICSALCDTVKVSHTHIKNVVRYYKVSHALLEKYRATLEECHTAS